VDEHGATVGAETGIDAGETQEQLLPRGRGDGVEGSIGVAGLMRRLGPAVRRRGSGQEAPGLLEPGVDVAAGEQAEVPDLGESGGQHVLEESADEFERRHGDRFAVLCGKAHAVVIQGLEAVVGDADAVGVPAEVSKDVLDAGKWAFGVDQPRGLVETIE